ncbi:MAG: hypothetical protein ACOZQL_34300 [Myxococcota bacterium]
MENSTEVARGGENQKALGGKVPTTLRFFERHGVCFGTSQPERGEVPKENWQ